MEWVKAFVFGQSDFLSCKAMFILPRRSFNDTKEDFEDWGFIANPVIDEKSYLVGSLAGLVDGFLLMPPCCQPKDFSKGR